MTKVKSFKTYQTITVNKKVCSYMDVNSPILVGAGVKKLDMEIVEGVGVKLDAFDGQGNNIASKIVPFSNVSELDLDNTEDVAQEKQKSTKKAKVD